MPSPTSPWSHPFNAGQHLEAVEENPRKMLARLTK